MFLSYKIPFSLFLLTIAVSLVSGQVKETHQIIEEWVKTKQIFSEEKSTWKSEKAALLDIEGALSKEIEELEGKLLQLEKENVGADQQRAELTNRKEKAKDASLQFYQGMQQIEKEVQRPFPPQ